MMVVVNVWGRPWTLNGERSGLWRAHREHTKAWRAAAGTQLLQLRPKRFDRVSVYAVSFVKQPLADTGNHYPAVKAVIDALVDVEGLGGDTGRYVPSITMHAPIPVSQEAAERLRVVFAAPGTLDPTSIDEPDYECALCGQSTAGLERLNRAGGVCDCARRV